MEAHHPSWYGSPQPVFAKRFQFLYTSDPDDILKITHFFGITAGKGLPDALFRAQTEDGEFAVQCPWEVYRRLQSCGAKEVAGDAAWDDAEAQFRKAMKTSSGWLGWLSSWFGPCLGY